MSAEITFIRHGETEANAGGVWQGTEDSPLTDGGLTQIELLAKRHAARPFDLVVASNLGRARQTAAALGGYEVDRRWQELHLGAWEGKTQREIATTDPASFAAVGSGKDIAFGGGERVSEMLSRLNGGLDDLVSRLDDGDRAAVVGHGGALMTLISYLLGVDTQGKLLRLTNTAQSTFTVRTGAPLQLSVFNDATHLPEPPVRAEEGATHVVLARHGETVANIEGRWQGQSEGELTSNGREQARRLGAQFPKVQAVFSSPLRRASDTAHLMAEGTGAVPTSVPDLQELGFGTWEMRTIDEIVGLDPIGWRDFLAGVDIVRGSSGETFAALSDRVGNAVRRLASQHDGDSIGVVSHGAATRALATEVLGLDYANRDRLAMLDNAAIALVVFGSRGAALGSWNLTAHLEC